MFEYVGIDHAEELDRFVRRHPTGHFMQTSAWGRVKSDWDWTGILLKDERGDPLASVALLRHRGKRSGASFFYAPRGPVWPHERQDLLRRILEEARAYAKKEGAYLLRVDPGVEDGEKPFLKLMKTLRFRRTAGDDYSLFQPRLCYENDLAGVRPETLAERYHRSTRRNLRLAERNGVAVERQGEEEIPAFMRLMRLTAERDGFRARDEAYFRRILRSLSPEAVLYMAKCGGKTVAAGIAVHEGERSSFLYGCSDREGKRLRANEALMHAMQTDAIQAGCRFFDFRGVEGFPVEDNPHYGLHRFKKGFGADFRIYAGQFDRILRPGEAMLVRLGEWIRKRFGKKK